MLIRRCSSSLIIVNVICVCVMMNIGVRGKIVHEKEVRKRWSGKIKLVCGKLVHGRKVCEIDPPCGNY